MLKNQSNFSNKRKSLIPQMNNGLATPATSDPDLKSSIYSSHNNSKTLELLNKSSIVVFTIDEMLTDLRNESEIHNGSILLFPAIDKQDISTSHPNPPIKSWSLISYEDKLSEGSREFKSVRLILSEDRRLPRSFNDRASHTNKTKKFNNNDKIPA